MRNFDATSSGQVAVEVEFLFQFQDLMTSVGSALPLWLHAGLKGAIAWKRKNKLETDGLQESRLAIINAKFAILS